MTFTPADAALFFSRNDADDRRLGDFAKALPLLTSAEELALALDTAMKGETAKRHFVLAGYPDDEGIRLSGGRPGASQAPDAVRRPLYKMTPQLHGDGGDFAIWDLGNLRPALGDLSARHQMAESFASAALREGARWISIGGGHDYGFADAQAFIRYSQAQGARPLILNFDAHLDVRPTTRGLSSGTPFYRMLETSPALDFAEIGIQGHCNSRSHLEWAEGRGARIVSLEGLEASGNGLMNEVTRVLGDWMVKPRPVFLSVDIDVFSSAVAPGASASYPTGLMPGEIFPLLALLVRRLDVRALGVYEVSPALDSSDLTAKLAAQVIHRVLDPW